MENFEPDQNYRGMLELYNKLDEFNKLLGVIASAKSKGLQYDDATKELLSKVVHAIHIIAKPSCEALLEWGGHRPALSSLERALRVALDLADSTDPHATSMSQD